MGIAADTKTMLHDPVEIYGLQAQRSVHKLCLTICTISYHCMCIAEQRAIVVQQRTWCHLIGDDLHLMLSEHTSSDASCTPLSQMNC
jgi:hypothetical protein